LKKNSGKSGRIGRSIRREMSVSFSEADLPLEEAARNAPAAYVFSM
jgi:hypothetical protein